MCARNGVNMKKLGTITYDNFSFDDAVLEVTAQFNELKRSNSTIEYKGINVTFSFFRRTWVILVYEYDDQMFGKPEQPDDTLPEFIKSKWIGMPDGIDPKDPEWRSKLEASRTSQEPR